MKMYVFEYDNTSAGKLKLFLDHHSYAMMIGDHFYPFLHITEE